MTTYRASVSKSRMIIVGREAAKANKSSPSCCLYSVMTCIAIFIVFLQFYFHLHFCISTLIPTLPCAVIARPPCSGFEHHVANCGPATLPILDYQQYTQLASQVHSYRHCVNKHGMQKLVGPLDPRRLSIYPRSLYYGKGPSSIQQQPCIQAV